MPKTATQHRLDRVAAMIRDNECDALLVSHPRNRRYLTGLREDDEGVDDTAGWVVVMADGKATLFCSSLNGGDAGREVGDAAVVVIPAPLVDGILEAVTAHVREAGAKRFGFEPHLAWSWHADLAEALPGVELVPLWGQTEWVRMVKDDGEIAAIRRAAAITDAAYAAALAAMRPGVTEREIAWIIDRTVRERGGDPTPAFPTIVAAGANAALPHHAPDDTPLRVGQPVILDLGARVDGYCADITRTVVLGRAPKRLREKYDAIIAGMEAGIAMLRPGVVACDAAKTAIAAIETRFGFTPVHTLGHGVGLAIHEWPWVMPQEENVTLEPGMFATAEPGFYDPEWGGVRVEELVLVTADGPEIISTAPRDLVLPV